MTDTHNEREKHIAQMIREQYPKATYVKLVVSQSGHRTKVHYRTPEALRRDFISMRSLDGEWIKEGEPR